METGPNEDGTLGLRPVAPASDPTLCLASQVQLELRRRWPDVLSDSKP